MTYYDFDRNSVFCVFSQDELSSLLGVSLRTVQRSLAILRADDVLFSWRVGLQGANRYSLAHDILSYLRPQDNRQSDVSNPPI